MKQTRRDFLRGAVGWGGLLLAGSLELRAVRSAEPIRRAHRYLAAQQSADGAWRSGRYAAFREGDVLTPVVLWAMQAEHSERGGAATFTRGLEWLRQLTDTSFSRESPWPALRYPLFTASYAAQVFAREGDADRAAAWVKIIEALRTSEALGWPATDPLCGAWSDAAAPPRYVTPVPDMLAPNISATALAAVALSSAGHDPQMALPFIERCQNFAFDKGTQFDDGGFFFALNDPIRNKAGSAGRDILGQERFHSYGSATSDGYLALRACGLPREHPRVEGAAAWLWQRSDGLTNGGRWADGRAAARASLAFYQSQALASVLAELHFATSWSRTLRGSMTSALVTKQGHDGAWQGLAPDSCEDEPLLASAFALRALALLA
ncbi:MAG: hypothetical protein ABJF10_22565 [Chthoniobacter sp.]|uniref:hypothetical protein n=1 Tax=Chthoniobacter sp. TaxID=2510640 RepID=UPI0032A72C85